MAAYLIIGNNPEQQKKEARKICQKLGVSFKANHPDALIVEPERSIGIDQIRQIKDFLTKKNWQGKGKKLVVIWQAQLMTPEAQNAFLKTLEEPPGNSLIILLANNKNALLPTIISRCHLINLVPTPKQKEAVLQVNWQELVNLSLDQRLKTAESIAQDREKAQAWLENLIFTLQNQLVKEENSSLAEMARWLRLASQARQMLLDNVSPLYVLDWLMLKL